MKKFFLSKPGIISLCVFALVMAFMLHRVLAKQRTAHRERVAPPASVPKSEPKPVNSTPASTQPAKEVRPVPTEELVLEKEVEPPKLKEDMAYLDRYRQLGSQSRTDRDRQGNTITRRRTSAPPSDYRAETGVSELPRAGPSLRLQGKLPSKAAANAPGAEMADPSPRPAKKEKVATPRVAKEERFVPFGRPLKCELVFTIDSTMEETPIVALVVEPVYNNGLLAIPAGAELHGMARPDRLRDRIFSSRDWVLVFPREGSQPNGRQLRVQGLALDRAEPDANGLTWGITDGSHGLQGSVLRTLESEELKRFAATFVSAAALTLQERRAGARGSTQVLNTPQNAVMQGLSSSLENISAQIAEEIKRHGVFIRIPGGKQFYFYPQQVIHSALAAIPAP